MSIESKAMDHIRKVLENFGTKYFTKSGVLKRTTVIEALDNYDKDLIAAILKDDLLRKTYTSEIAGVEIFEINKFVDMLRFKEYWEDSFTKYNNKIGLTAGGKYIDDSSDVVLDFPYKDCVLKAGMTKEDVQTSEDAHEPFLNETLAKPEIDELLEPKIFVKATRYDKKGKRESESISENDNLIIKGNNLVALSSLEKRFAGKIKLIYLDLPFNTGNDSFLYNDSFNHSSWLTFVKNRIEIAQKLLKEDGLLFLEIDHNEEAYLKVLLDSIFGRSQYVNTIIVRSNSISGTKTAHKEQTILKNHDSILVYKARNHDIKLNPQYVAKEFWDTHYNCFLDEKNMVEKKLKDVLVEAGVINKNYVIKSSSWENEAFRTFVNNHKNHIFRKVNSIPQDLKRLSLKNKNKIVCQIVDGQKRFAKNGKRFSMLSSTYQVVDGELKPAQLLGDLWTDIDFQNTQNQGGVSFTNAKKPEQLLKRIINMTTSEHDIVLDFFMGSATTQAVAMKMHRRFIGIEQMDYINTVSVPRLQKVIAGEQGGISKSVHWQGGGSFIYVELMEKNQRYLRDINQASNMDELMNIYSLMKNNGDIDFRVDLAKFEASLKNGELPSLEDRKKELIKIIDKNQLYYNYNDLDDAEVRKLVSDTDYEFNKSFYSPIQDDKEK